MLVGPGANVDVRTAVSVCITVDENVEPETVTSSTEEKTYVLVASTTSALVVLDGRLSLIGDGVDLV